MPRFLYDLQEIVWLLFLASGLWLVAGLHRLAGVLVERGTVTERERRRFTFGAATVLITVGLSDLVAQVWAGVRNPTCIGVTPGTESVEQLLDWWQYALLAGFVLWVWRGRSFAFLVHLAPLIRDGPQTARTYSRRQVQLAVLGTLGVILAIAALMEGPVPPDLCRPGEPQLRWDLEQLWRSNKASLKSPGGSRCGIIGTAV